jgi:hypothetical protein
MILHPAPGFAARATAIIAGMKAGILGTWATVEYADVPGVSRGEGAALVDLPARRGGDALVHVVWAFESASRASRSHAGLETASRAAG